MLLYPQVLRRSGTAQEQKYAKAIEPVRAPFRAAQMGHHVPSIKHMQG